VSRKQQTHYNKPTPRAAPMCTESKEIVEKYIQKIIQLVFMGHSIK